MDFKKETWENSGHGKFQERVERERSLLQNWSSTAKGESLVRAGIREGMSEGDKNPREL
ncbi:hypothetical protein K0M31_013085 [Melipona bicolor]|uniref:Uncharacterized protein n=1 Tax=Melipona bicolor TaxID=60889 RepID=A0AA40FID2_9HYME|nr:hypothetical protein K0M31_013085 [Melipona bicolor]